MKIFTKFGNLILRMFDIIGVIILEIPGVPDRLREINTGNIKDKVDTEVLKENISKIKNDSLKRISKLSRIELSEISEKKSEHKRCTSANFESEEKERTVFILQIMSGTFLVISMPFIFNFLSLTLYVIFGVASIAYILYTLFSKVKLMYDDDFNAYRDFFLMYVAVGIILVLAGTNPNFVMSFSFEFLPSLSVLIFAVIAVVAIFLIFRIKHRRNFTYGTVIETGKKTAHVKVDYDICSNINPDIYIVDNSLGAADGDKVKLHIEEKLLSMKGNKPSSIIEILN